MKLFDSTLTAIEKKLDLSLKRHAVLSSNVANQETPNYISREYSFSDEVAKALGTVSDDFKKTSSKHLDLEESSGSHVIFDKSMPVGADGNNVDLDIEMGKLSANSRDYSNSLNLLATKLKMIKAATSGKGGF